MAKTRAKPLNWAVNEKLTSAQMNTVDQNAAECLDKTAAGDTLSGYIVVGNGGAIDLAHASAYLKVSAAGAKVSSDVAGGIQPSVAGGIRATVARGIEVDVAGGLRTTSPGGIVLGGGSTDEIQYSAARGYSRIVPPIAAKITGSWNVSTKGALVGNGDTTEIVVPVRDLPQGATLTHIGLIMFVGTSHAGVPASLPAVQLYRRAFDAGATVTLMNTGSALEGVPASGAAWYASGNVQLRTWAVNVGGIIDKRSYIYEAVITDESGSNSASGNQFLGFELTFGSITQFEPF